MMGPQKKSDVDSWLEKMGIKSHPRFREAVMRVPKLLFLPRRRYFVNRSLQGRLVLGMVGAAILSFVFVLIDFYLSFGRNAGWDLDMLSVFLKAQKLPLIQLVVFVFVLVFVTVYLSHRVAGPLINLEKSLVRIAEGDLTTRLQLRPRDELKNIRDSFNIAVESLYSRVSTDRIRAKEIKLLIEQMVANQDLKPAEAAEMNRAVALLGTLTSEFKL